MLRYEGDVLRGSKISCYIVRFLPAFCSGLSFFYESGVSGCKIVRKGLIMKTW